VRGGGGIYVPAQKPGIKDVHRRRGAAWVDDVAYILEIPVSQLDVFDCARGYIPHIISISTCV